MNSLVLSYKNPIGVIRLFKTSDLYGRMYLTYHNIKMTNVYEFHSNCHKEFKIPNKYDDVINVLENSGCFDKSIHRYSDTWFETILKLNSTGYLYLL